MSYHTQPPRGVLLKMKGLQFQGFTQTSAPCRERYQWQSSSSLKWGTLFSFFFSADAEVNCGAWSCWNTLHSLRTTISGAITQPTKLNIPNALSRRQLRSLIWKLKKMYFLLWITWIRNRATQRGIAVSVLAGKMSKWRKTRTFECQLKCLKFPSRHLWKYEKYSVMINILFFFFPTWKDF